MDLIRIDGIHLATKLRGKVLEIRVLRGICVPKREEITRV
jgi:hypothetical protein